VARRPSLSLWLLLGIVLAAHLWGLEWFAREREALSLLQALPPPMFTRLLQPTEPVRVAAMSPVVAPRPKPPAAAVALKPKPPASAAKAQREQAEEKALAPAPAEAVAASPAEPEPTPVQQAAAAPEPAASASIASIAGLAASAEADAAAMAAWPPDTRLNYRLGGQFRSGPLFGDARVQWQRDGSKYQVRLEMEVRPFTSFAMTSQGDVTPQGLVPRAYEEYRPGKRRAAQFGEQAVTLENGSSVPRPADLQDTASQFVELTHRFSTARDLPRVGQSVTLSLGRPGGVDAWIYDIVETEMLQTPRLGAVEALHLVPRPLKNPRGNITAEMWFAPSLQYLPVRIKVLMGDDTWLDLIVEKIEQ
jgi:hypothetical protein